MINAKLRRVSILIASYRAIDSARRIHRLEMGRLSILGFFWPLLKILLIPFVAYISYGSVLEQDSGIYRVPYRAYVFSGLTPWVLLSLILSSSLRIWSTAGRRRLMLRLNNGCLSTLIGSIYSYRLVLFLLLLVLFILECGIWGVGESLLRVGVYCLFLSSMVFFWVALSWAIGIVSATTRDIRQIIPYAMIGLLFLSPVYYFPRDPNSTFEAILKSVNFFGHYLYLAREILFASTLPYADLMIFAFPIILISFPFYLFRSLRLSIEVFMIRAFMPFDNDLEFED